MHTFAGHKITSIGKICSKFWFKLKFRDKMFLKYKEYLHHNFLERQCQHSMFSAEGLCLKLCNSTGVNGSDKCLKSSIGSHLFSYRNKHGLIKISELQNDVKEWMGWTVKPAGGRDLRLKSILRCEVARKN